MPPTLPAIVQRSRQSSPALAPQALAWHQGKLWIGSRDARRLYGVDPQSWTVVEESATPGIPWGAVAAHGALYFVSGEDAEDDRYLRRYEFGRGFDDSFRVVLPEFTGSYLSFDGQHLYLSQWYKQRVLQLSSEGQVLRMIDVGAEICGQVFVGAHLHVLRGTEKDGENWRLARLDLSETTPRIEDLAQMGFACRSLAFDGQCFWTNHRAANQTVSFTLPPNP